MKSCIIDNCENQSRRRDMCSKHYSRWYRHGCTDYISRESHGKSRTVEYNLWCNIIARCENKKHPYYRNYGGRGITVSKEWRNSFTEFLKDMGERPSDLHQIDRINNNKGYSKENCEWATHQENSNNRFYKNTGTFYNKALNKWQTEVRYNGKRYYLGLFSTMAEGAEAYQKKAKELGRCIHGQ